jgi:16S rRNA (adenine1518-N6/adenine1519-N6)-dimethyltransferase
MLPLGDGFGDRHVMVDEDLIGRLCDYAGVSEKDTVLEVGAGTGNLTEALLERGATVVAVEKDARFYEYLVRAFPKEKRLKLICGDATKIRFPRFNKVVSNLPYSISKKMTLRLLDEGFEGAVLVYQREFAQKLTAKPLNETYRFITVLVQSTCRIEVLEEVSPKAFQPQPNVWSAVVRITPQRKLDKEYSTFVQNLFNHKNKKIRNIMEEAPAEYADRKPVELSPDELAGLYSLIK